MTAQEGYDLLMSIIDDDYRHRHYEVCVGIAKEAKTYLAQKASDQKHRLDDIRLLESEEQKDQRARLSTAVTSVALAPVYAYFQEVWRTDGVSKTVETDNERIGGFVADHFRNYYHEDSLHKYCFDAALHFQKTDPNAWTVFEVMFSQGMQGETQIIDLYPVEVLSKEVRDYAYDQTGTLQYLAFEFMRTVHKMDNRSHTKEVSDFYLYGIGFSVHFAESDTGYTGGTMDYEARGYQFLRIKGRDFFAKVFTNTTTEVPAIRWSAYLSHKYERKVGETPVATAIPKLEELLKDNSLLQVQKYAHIFAEKHQYVRRCEARDEIGRECEGGYYGGTYSENDRCRVCKGSGKIMAASEQDVVTLAWPDRAEELVDLAKITHYVERPIDIVQFYREEVNAAVNVIFQATFNQQQVDLNEVVQAVTATQARLDYDKIYNKLSPFAEIVSRAWEKAQRTGFQYYGVEASVDMSYPHDFKMKSISELIIEYAAAKDAGAPYSVMESIARDMIAKQHRNDPLLAADVMAFERWKPWKDKSPEEIIVILQSRDENDAARVLWENWDQITELVELDLAGVPFSLLPADEQRRVLYDKVPEFVTGISYRSMPDPFQPAQMMEPEDDENLMP